MRHDSNLLQAFMPIRSTVITKVPKSSLPNLNRAIIHRESPTYQELYADFGLAEVGVSFTAFYYYARQLRTASALTELRRVPIPPGQTVYDVLPNALAHALLDAALDPTFAPQAVERLSRAYRLAESVRNSRKRLELDEADHRHSEQQREIEEITDMAIRLNKVKLADAQVDLALARTANAAARREDEPAETAT